VIKQLVLLLQIWEAPGSKPDLKDENLDKVLLQFPSFSPDKCQHNTSNKIMNTSFLNIIFSFFGLHPSSHFLIKHILENSSDSIQASTASNLIDPLDRTILNQWAFFLP
jgi:hypothetical protein